MRKKLGILVTFAVIAILVALPVGSASAAPPPVQGVRLTPIGNPIWTPVDVHLSSLEIGTWGTGFAEFYANIQAILPPPNHSWHDALAVGPGQPHQPPYDTEMGEGIANLGLHEGVQFSPDEFSNGMGVMVSWMTVPAPGTTGSSPDFSSGPIIPNSLFPIQVRGIAYHNNRLFDPWLAYTDVPALDQIVPPFLVDGHSHFPMFVATNADLGLQSKLEGSYTYKIEMIDTSGNGWQIDVHFAVGG